ncbi:amidohydrolase [Brevibacterium sanguinis]|uniref:Amidohydrolase n=2 Tax=Brevibacterium TaxID=1696 RepID=A0A366INT6_9MICO|nr:MULTISPECIES: amidohydrolase [Brevibacterium]RBP68074.1 amidohydrolase [Brevibacterium sanguinis]RBP74509.1 amidohydrolase [Brevibacterium celere]
MISSRIADIEAELIEFRRDIHAHPELSFQEFATTDKIVARLEAAGLTPQRLEGTGLVCEVGSGPLALALRADIDALPVDDLIDEEFRSTVPGVAHACGHDVHLTALMGAGIALQRIHTSTPGGLGARVRLIFQPAEEVTPGGALRVIAQGVLDDVPEVYALHCDPNVDVGKVGSRIGAITAAGDTLIIRLSGHGGHTSRPHLTEDLVYALAKLATDLPSTLGRLIDPRHAISLVWGEIGSGHAANVVPSEGILRGTLRCLDVAGWNQVAEVLPGLVERIAGPYGVEVDLEHRRGVPPVVNTEEQVTLIESAVRGELGENAVQLTPQSMGGEDFAWYLTHCPGALVRVGTRTPGGTTYDIHQGDLLVDESSVGVAARIYAATALKAIDARR